jgi:hypothetical protein
MANLLTNNPFVVLYGLQACTYVLAAILLRRADHKRLTLCYWISAFLHGLLGGCYLIHSS